MFGNLNSECFFNPPQTRTVEFPTYVPTESMIPWTDGRGEGPLHKCIDERGSMNSGGATHGRPPIVSIPPVKQSMHGSSIRRKNILWYIDQSENNNFFSVWLLQYYIPGVTVVVGIGVVGLDFSK